MEMGYILKYFYTLLTLLILCRAENVPSNKEKCTILHNLYPDKLPVNEILQACERSNINDVLIYFNYCKELVRVKDETCGLGVLLEHVSPGFLSSIAKTSLAIPKIEEEHICKVFRNLNTSLYQIYSEKEGFGNKLAFGMFCKFFCDAESYYCETLLRTYWIKKVLLDASQGLLHHDISTADSLKKLKDYPKTTSSKHEFPSHSMEQRNANPSTVSISSFFVTNEDKKPTETYMTTVHLPDQNNKSLPGRTNNVSSTKKLDDPNKPGNFKNSAQDLSAKPNNDNKHKDNQSTISYSKTKLQHSSPGNHENQHTTSAYENDKYSIAETNKKPEDFQDLNAKVKAGDGQKAVGSEAKLTNNNKDSNDQESGVNMKYNDDDQKNGVSEITENKPVKASQQNENDNAKEINDTEGQIPVVPDRTTGADGTTLEKDKYEDGPQDEPDVTIDGSQIDPKNSNSDKNLQSNLQSDAAIVEKQANNIPRISDEFPEEEDSHFFAYFLTIVVLCIAGYLVFHNKQKIIALIIEGRHERRRRPNNGTYKRLDSKDSAKTTSHVIF